MWLESLLTKNTDVRISELCDYEVRRGLLRVANSLKKTDIERAIHRDTIGKLDALKSALGYIPITTAIMLKAAEFWADMRNRGYPTASDEALDGDMILCAQVAMLAADGHTVVVATENTKHLSHLITAKMWRDITAEEK